MKKLLKKLKGISIKKVNLIYAIIAMGFGLIGAYWMFPTETMEEIAIWYFVIVLGIAAILMILLPIWYWVFMPTEGSMDIKEGEHRVVNFPKFFIYKKRAIARVKFDENCRYEGSDQLEEQYNKLFGFGELNHQKRSHRVAWRYNKVTDKIDLFEYKYVDGERLEPIFMKSVELGEYFEIELVADKAYWFGVILNPYFGGEAPAPHYMYIFLDYK